MSPKRAKRPGRSRDVKRRLRKTNDAGRAPVNYAKPIRWKLDVDYWDKLSPDEARWLAENLDAYYGGDFRGQSQTNWPQTVRRQVWQDKHACLEDAYGQAELFGAVQVLSDTSRLAADPRTAAGAAPADLRPAPDYLDTPEYKAARDNYRSVLHPGRKPRAPKTVGRAGSKLRHAELVLAMVVPAAEGEEPTDE